MTKETRIVLTDSRSVKRVRRLLAKELEEGVVKLRYTNLIFPMEDPLGFLSELLEKMPVDAEGKGTLLSLIRKLHKAS